MLTKSLLPLVLFALTAPAVYANQCSPDYEVVHSQCKNTDSVIGTELIPTSFKDHDPDCNDPAPEHKCQHEFLDLFLAQHPELQREQVTYVSYSWENIHDSVCSYDGYKTRGERNLQCNYKIPGVQFSKVTDSSCPIINVVDRQNCFVPQNSSVEIDSNSIALCLAGPANESEAELWVKGKCVSDLAQAIQNLQLVNRLKPTELKRIQQLGVSITNYSAMKPELQPFYDMMSKTF